VGVVWLKLKDLTEDDLSFGKLTLFEQEMIGFVKKGWNLI
jgi:hypothetical protein